MNENNYLIEAFDSLVSLVEYVNERPCVSVPDIYNYLNGKFSDRSIHLSLNFYISNLIKSSQSPLFNTSEFGDYGEEINRIIIFLISNSIVQYSKIGLVIDRLSLLNLAGAISIDDVKRVFASMIFDDVAGNSSHFEIN